MKTWWPRTRKYADLGWMNPTWRDRNSEYRPSEPDTRQQSHLAPVMTVYAVHYVVMASVGPSLRVINPFYEAIDTGSGYKVIRRNALHVDWQENVLHEENVPAIGDANGNPLHIHYSIGLPIKFGVALYRIRFIVVETSHFPLSSASSF